MGLIEKMKIQRQKLSYPQDRMLIEQKPDVLKWVQIIHLQRLKLHPSTRNTYDYFTVLAYTKYSIYNRKEKVKVYLLLLFYCSPIKETNKGFKMLKKMGWAGESLGNQQNPGLKEPVSFKVLKINS